MTLPKDYTNQKFNRLTALKFIGYTSSKIKRRIWLCRCDCGTLKELCIENVVRTKDPTKSCGCLIAHQHTGFMALVYAVFTENKYNDDGLTLSEFYQLSQQNCHYCNASPSNTRKKRGKQNISFTYNGLDRLDNDQKHSKDNVVPCCWDCNNMKKNKNYQQFLNKIQNIYLNCKIYGNILASHYERN